MNSDSSQVRLAKKVSVRIGVRSFMSAPKTANFLPRLGHPIDFCCIATGTWYNARVSKSPCEYKNGAVTFYFAILERARDQKELPYSER
jgi:hypothetical protein